MCHIGICIENERTAAQIAETLRGMEEREALRLRLKFFQMGEKLMEEMVGGYAPDVLFLDVEGGEVTGVRVGGFVREWLENLKVRILYVTEEEACTPEMIRTMPTDLLVKKEKEQEWLTTLKDAVDRLARILKKEKEKFEFKYGKNYFTVPLKDIYYFCSDMRKVRLKASHGEFEYNGLLRDVIKRLPQEFLVIHKSFVINKNHVLHYTYETVELTDGTTLNISKTNRSRVKACLVGGMQNPYVDTENGETPREFLDSMTVLNS